MLPKLIILFTLFLSNCRIATPFLISKDSANDPEKNVIVSITYAQIADNSNKNKSFWKNVGLIKENAKENSGLIGISISKKIFGNEAWTMTVWETEEDLENFIISKRHSQAIDESEEALSNSKFARLKMKRKEIPLAWDKALNILAEQKSRFHTYYDN